VSRTSADPQIPIATDQRHQLSEAALATPFAAAFCRFAPSTTTCYSSFLPPCLYSTTTRTHGGHGAALNLLSPDRPSLLPLTAFWLHRDERRGSVDERRDRDRDYDRDSGGPKDERRREDRREEKREDSRRDDRREEKREDRLEDRREDSRREERRSGGKGGGGGRKKRKRRSPEPPPECENHRWRRIVASKMQDGESLPACLKRIKVENKPLFDLVFEAADKLVDSGYMTIYNDDKEAIASVLRENVARREAEAAAEEGWGGASNEPANAATAELSWEYTTIPPYSVNVCKGGLDNSEGQIHGPFPTSTMLQWNAQGAFTAEQMWMRRCGAEEWIYRKGQDLEELFSDGNPRNRA